MEVLSFSVIVFLLLVPLVCSLKTETSIDFNGATDKDLEWVLLEFPNSLLAPKVTTALSWEGSGDFAWGVIQSVMWLHLHMGRKEKYA